MVRSMEPADLARLAVPSQPVISPDGLAVVYVLNTVDCEADEQRSSLWEVAVAGGPPAPLTFGTADSSPAWSPDGRRIAFLRRVAGGPPQVWLLPAGGGEPAGLTTLPDGAGAPVWSPDGSRIAFTAPVGATDQPDHAPIAIDRLGYKLDGVGFWRGRRRHLFTVDVATGAARQLTRGDWHAGDPAWSPDGQRIAFTAAVAPDADLTGESELHVIELASGRTRQVGGWRGATGSQPVRWTPDGTAVVLVGREDLLIGHNHLLRVPLDSGSGGVTDLTAGLDRNVMPGSPGYPGGLPQFTMDGQSLLFCVRVRGCTHLYRLAGDRIGPVLDGPDRVVSALSVATGAARAAVVVAGPHSYGEVAVVDLDTGAATVLTDHGLPDVALSAAEERVFTISDGTEVHGWLIRDPAAPTPAPLLLDIHGGPHNAWTPAPSAGRPYRQWLAARGWAVLLLNPRGSDGYGEAFFTAQVGRWGLADERDFLEPVEALVTEGIADPDRLAVTGYSYGGYMTCWLTGHTDRFAAAVPGGAVTDLASAAGTSDLGHWLAQRAYQALPYADPERVTAQSPYPRVGTVRTPTLLLHGVADERCPAGQAEQWFAALRGQGVPAQLVLYPGASHGFLYNGRPSHWLDYSRRLVDWVTRYAGPPRSAATGTRRPIEYDRWQRRLAELAERFGVPGAALGIAHGDQLAQLACGVTNVDTGVEVTPDALFQIGSITKVWTATAVMRLVDDGRLELDKPVVSYLPELRLSDPDATGRVTMRQLLTHTSGIDGDFFHDPGRGDDCLARYVAALAEQPRNHPLGATFSYCNAGYSVAGRVIEVLTGQVWDEAMRELLLEPLGVTRTVTLPEEAILHRTAVGHVHGPGEPFRRTPVWGLPRSAGPAGTISSTVGEVLAFVRFHLDGGVTAGGQRLLPAQAVAAMRAAQPSYAAAALPDRYAAADSWGIGWWRADRGGHRQFGHDGNTLGQSAFLRVLPEHQLAVVLLTNGGFAQDLSGTLLPELVSELAGVTMPAPLTPPAVPPKVDIGRYAGSYRRTGIQIDVAPDGRMRVDRRFGPPGMDRPPDEYELVPVHEDVFAIRPPGARTWQPVTFYRLADGSPYLHFGLRATPRVEPG